MNNAEYIVKKLEELGIDRFFTIISNLNNPLIDSVNDNKNTDMIICTNSLNACFAADGYARIRGYGAVITGNKDEELSIVNAVAGAFYENVPLIVLVSISRTENNNLEDFGSSFSNVFNSITSANVILTKENASLEIDRVLKILVKEKKPVYIGIPDDIASLEKLDTDISYEWESNTENLENAADIIAAKINSSKYPVIVGGSLIKRFNSVIEYKEFTEKSGIPVATDISGINIINMNLKNYIGLYDKDKYDNDYVNNSDCIISVGELSASYNKYKPGINNADYIEIKGNAVSINGKLYDDIMMSDILENLTDKIIIEQYVNSKHSTKYEKKLPKQQPLTNEYIYYGLQNYIKENDIIITETDDIMKGIYEILYPDNVNIELQTTWVSNGWATAALLGVLVAKPSARVILITEKYAHIKSAFELSTILKCGFKPIILVNDCQKFNEDANKFDLKINYTKFTRVFEGEVWPTKVYSEDDYDKALKVTQVINKMCYIELITSNVRAECDSDNESIHKINVRNVDVPNTDMLVFKKEHKSDIIKLNKNIEFSTSVHPKFIYDDKDDR